jgi:hypothetical protein
MKISFILFIIFAVAIVSSFAAATSSPPPPAWVAYGSLDFDSGATLVGGVPIRGELNDGRPYTIGSITSILAGNTTICLFDAVKNGTCQLEILNLPNFSSYVERMISVGAQGDLFFDVRDTDHNLVTTYYYNGESQGVEWFVTRGVQTYKTSFLLDPKRSLVFMSQANSDGSGEIILGGFVAHTFNLVWSTPLFIPPAFQKPFTAYSADFCLLDKDRRTTTLGFIFLSTVYALNISNGKIVNSVASPCGYNSTSLRLIRDEANQQLHVYGNVADPKTGQLRFMICSLTLDSSLTQTGLILAPLEIIPINGEQSVATLRLYYNKTGVRGAEDYFFVSGINNGKFFFWVFSLTAQQFMYRLSRSQTEQYNMPIVYSLNENSNDEIIVSLNGVLKMFDPRTVSQSFVCSFSCASAPAPYFDHYMKTDRLVCVSSAQPSQLIAVNVGNVTDRCQIAWQVSLDDAVSLKTLAYPLISTSSVYPLEPFVVVVTASGTLWSVSIRSSTEPAPIQTP